MIISALYQALCQYQPSALPWAYINAQAWYTGQYENSRVITSKYSTFWTTTEHFVWLVCLPSDVSNIFLSKKNFTQMSLFFSFKYKYVVNYWLSVDCAAVQWQILQLNTVMVAVIVVNRHLWHGVSSAALPSVEFAPQTPPRRGRKRRHFDDASTQSAADLAKRRSTRVRLYHWLLIRVVAKN